MGAVYRIMLISVVVGVPITLVDEIIIFHVLSKALSEFTVRVIVFFLGCDIAQELTHLLVITTT